MLPLFVVADACSIGVSDGRCVSVFSRRVAFLGAFQGGFARMVASEEKSLEQHQLRLIFSI